MGLKFSLRVRNLFLIFSFLSINLSWAQFSVEEQQEIDRLSSIISNQNSHDTAVADAYLDLSGMLYVSNFDTMIPVCLKALSIVKNGIDKTSDSLVIKKFRNIESGSYNNIGFAHLNIGNIDSAIFYILKSIEIIEILGDKEGIALGLNNIGYIYNEQGHVEKALEYYHKSLKIEEEIGNKDGIATSFNNIAFIYKKQGEVDKALEYLLEESDRH